MNLPYPSVLGNYKSTVGLSRFIYSGRYMSGIIQYVLKGHEFEQTQGDSEGQESLAGCSSWGHKELGTT